MSAVNILKENTKLKHELAQTKNKSNKELNQLRQQCETLKKSESETLRSLKKQKAEVFKLNQDNKRYREQLSRLQTEKKASRESFDKEIEALKLKISKLHAVNNMREVCTVVKNESFRKYALSLATWDNDSRAARHTRKQGE